MPNISELQQTEGAVNAMIMGRPGTGKTALVSTFPDLALWDFDNKVGAALNPDWVRKVGKAPNFEYRTFREKGLVKGYAITHNAFDDACHWFDELERVYKNRFQYYAIDSVTTMSDYAANKALIVLGGAKRSTTHDTATKVGLAMLQKQDFGGINSMVKQFIRMLLDSGKGVIAIVHEKETTNEGGLVTSVDPMLIGQNVQNVPAMFQNVWHLTKQGVGSNVKRVLDCDGDGIRMARSELGLGRIEEPTYDKIRAKIKERQALIPKSPVGTPPSGGPQPPLAVAK